MYTITCCKDCVPPERYPGCSDHCNKYKQQKAAFERRKAECRQQSVQRNVTEYDFHRTGVHVTKRYRKHHGRSKYSE